MCEDVVSFVVHLKASSSKATRQACGRPSGSLEVDVAAREARDDAEAKRVAADLMGDSDSSQTPIVVSKIEEARALDEQIQEPELSPRLAAVRGALSEIQAMGTVDVDDPILSPPGSPASSRRALTPKASVFTSASRIVRGSSMLDSKSMTAASHVPSLRDRSPVSTRSRRT